MQNNLLTGKVQSGVGDSAMPLAGVQVSVFHTGDDGHVALAKTSTGTAGQFSVSVPAVSGAGIFYARADVLGGVQLVACMGRALPDTVCLNELTSVAAAFSLAQFIGRDTVTGNAFALGIAAGMNDNLVATRTGESSPVLLGAPNGDQTIALRVTRALANLLAACVQEPNHAPVLLYRLATTPPQNAIPLTSFQALANIARHPAQNVGQLYDNSLIVQKYLPALSGAPDAWTIAVKVNDTGGVNVPFGGPANIAFDRNGYAWIANNVVQGTPVSTGGIAVLRPDGKPADGQGGTARSPLTGGGLLGPGFGVAIDRADTAWVGNFGWGGFDPAPTGMGSVSRFGADGQPISPVAGYQGGAVRVQAVAVDQDDNVWLASFGNDSVVVFMGGDPKNPVSYQEPTGSGPFGVAIAADGSAWVTNSGGLSGENQSSVCKYMLQGGVLSQQFSIPVGKALKGVSLDSLGNAWVASGGDDTVYLFSPQGQLLGSFGGGGVNGPWGVALDGDDNAWVANFGPLVPGSRYTDAAVSNLAGANDATRLPGLAAGEPLSPDSGYTLRSAGEQVLLPTGEPLYGPGRPPCYSPLMRQTSCVIDQAGNVWTVNNWKPDFTADVLHNPGGDGVVIFVGLARPPANRWAAPGLSRGR